MYAVLSILSNKKMLGLDTSSGSVSVAVPNLGKYSADKVDKNLPPLLATAEAPVLAKHVGQIAVVIEADKTRQHVLQNALAELDSSKEIGLILNKCRTKPHTHSYYGYNYGYGESS